MIALYLFWDGTDPGRVRAAALAGSLRTGLRAPRPHLSNGAILCAADAGLDDAPPQLPDGTAVLFAGFIANRRALRAELGDLPPGDAALYAAAHARWGAEAEPRIHGEYAAILVPPGGAPVRLLRAPITAPALYYHHDRERLIVATTPAAIFATGEVARELDDRKIADSLFLNYTEERRGWFRGITRLPRGARARVTRDGVHEEQWYRIEEIAPVRLPRDSDYVEALDALFAEATEAVLDGFDKPVMSLSGGFDSQAVAVYAMRARGAAPLLSATSVPQPGWSPPAGSPVWSDERPHVEALAAMYPQLDPRWITAPGRDISHHQRDLFETAMAPPRNAANLHWIHDIRTLARNEGADVVLTGAMGNLTFSYDGSGYMPELLRQGRWGTLARELWLGGPRTRVAKRAVRQALLPNLPAAIQKKLIAWRDGPPEDPLQSWSPLRADYARQTEVHERAAALGFDPEFRPPHSVAEYRRRMLANAIAEGGDVMTGLDRLHGLPTRDPTRYRPLLEFCFAIPVRQYLHRGTRRWLARRLLAGKVPGMVLHETRRGRQAADWSSRLRPRRAAILEELEFLAADPDVAGRIDIPRLRRALEEMPQDDADLTRDHVMTLHLALGRALTTARFIRYIKGHNDI
jgi:asparagine synthase (glutamine-hydrolysing)